MPTYFTAAVESGEVTSFKEYARHCAQAFCYGDWNGREFPTVKLDEDRKDQLRKATEELRDFLSLSDEELRAAYAIDISSHRQSHDELVEKYKTEKKRYLAMKRKADQFTPPTKDHIRFYQFILEQIQLCIPLDKWMEPFEEVSFCVWETSRRDQLMRNVAYRSEDWDKAQERYRIGKEWLNRLADAIDEVDD